MGIMLDEYSIFFYSIYFSYFCYWFFEKEQDYINYESRIYTHLWS